MGSSSDIDSLAAAVGISNSAVYNLVAHVLD